VAKVDTAAAAEATAKADPAAVAPVKTDAVTANPVAVTGLANFRDAVRASGNRNVNVANAYLNTPQTNATALSALNESQPRLMTSAVLETLRSNPALQKPVLASLRTLDGRSDGMFKTTPQESLASLIDKLARAEREGNEGRVTALSMQLDAFVANPANARAVSDLFVATTSTTANGVDGRTALTATISNAVTAAGNASAGAGNVAGLPGYSITGGEFVATVTNAMVAFDPSRAAQNAAIGIGVIANERTHDGRIIPFVAYPNGKGDKPEEPNRDLPRDQPLTTPDNPKLPEPPVPETPQPPEVVPNPTGPVPQPPLPGDPKLPPGTGISGGTTVTTGSNVAPLQTGDVATKTVISKGP
jgi:hypothetical protein